MTGLGPILQIEKLRLEVEYLNPGLPPCIAHALSLCSSALQDRPQTCLTSSMLLAKEPVLGRPLKQIWDFSPLRTGS